MSLKPLLGSGISSSLVGTAAESADADEHTMSLNLSSKRHPSRYRRTILHEFGHALGLKHEHQHPHAPKLINESELWNYLRTRHQDWSDQKIRDRIGTQWLCLGEGASQAGKYDRNSIMHYL